MEITFNSKFKLTDRVLILSSKAHKNIGVITAVHFTKTSVSSGVGYLVQVEVKNNLLCSSADVYVEETALRFADETEEGKVFAQTELEAFAILMEEKEGAERIIVRIEEKLKERFGV